MSKLRRANAVLARILCSGRTRCLGPDRYPRRFRYHAKLRPEQRFQVLRLPGVERDGYKNSLFRIQPTPHADSRTDPLRVFLQPASHTVNNFRILMKNVLSRKGFHERSRLGNINRAGM